MISHSPEHYIETSNNNKKYTINNIKEFFTDLKSPNTHEIYLTQKRYFMHKAPNVPVNCIFSHNITTAASFLFDKLP
jgi:hypothetical protein